jgi:arylsulfatase A-like enzyme
MNNEKPNLIYIFADQWRRQAMGFSKEDPVITPNMDKFAEGSMVFNNAISCFPLCSPHRASLLTGKYPLSTGMFTNCKIGCDVRLKEEEICIGEVLKAGKYKTGYIGKWHLDLPELNLCDAPISGAKDWDAFTEQGPKRHGFDFWHSYGAWDEHLTPHYWEDTSKMIKINQWSVEHETDVAIDYIRKNEKNKPFALFISWNPPHSPYDQVPEKYKKIYEDNEIKFRANVSVDPLTCHTGEVLEGGFEKVQENTKNYFAAVTGLDDNLGRILKELKAQGLHENTIVVLTSDHGEMMASHGLMTKHVWYEESIGVPFIISWPGKIKKGSTNALLNTPDIMPTLLSLLDLEVPSTVEGIDLSEVVKGECKSKMESAFICACPGRDVFLKAFEEKGRDPKEFGWRGVRTERYTYVAYKGYYPNDDNMERILYDNQSDPFQMNPVSIENIEENTIAKELEGELINWLVKLKDPFLI